MNGLGLFALIFGVVVILFIPLRPRPHGQPARRHTRGPINLTLHRTDRP